MIRINQLALEVGHGPGAIKKKAARLLKVPETSIRRVDVVRRSIDARKKDRILYSYIVDVKLAEKKKEETAVKKADSRNIQIETEARYRYPAHGKEVLKDRPVIIGAGPAGLFAALALAENGFAPLLLEQGDPVEVRAEKVEAFWRNGDDSLDLHSNVQFGEGGAGTFSDGKLNTLVKDVFGRNGKVLETFVEAGADGSILYDSRPHIGTDVLREVVKNIRKRIQDAGGEVRFGCRVEQVLMEDGRTGGVLLAGGERIQSRTVVLAVGHSARALFSSLWEQKVLMEPKAFAVGLRVQHPQKMINLSQYGREDAGELGAAPYKVTASTKSGRGVYSFCMCPGGYVVNASSEKGRLAVNGMSNFRRDGENANSAIIVSVTPGDFPVPGALGGVEFQRRLEEKAFLLGNGRIPVQLYGDFKEDRRSEALGDVAPQFCGGYALSNLRELMPEALNTAFIEGMEQFGKKIRGFDRSDALLAGIESRTSSPLKIIRDENLESSVKGLYPCGEGAGYAGGITSAAMDGLKVAEEIIRRYCPA
ncbi:NAD(P)/FAD-dependent oxidoreductase [Alitiscatomonas aceti]|uniref:FAD-binding protein n=1 Tax=Alitiscatomonas aceti TaxID=2981724 RepID=A0ABT2UUQ7_9FIRM|nr:FAD-binding protein [Alitiscatomonas aceti]MCU6798395.1 FAD-binding protein [Alitiscatomonas aceti]